jgi:diacylglycerol kinase (ATP)
MPSSFTIKIRTVCAPSRRSRRCSLFVALLHNPEAGDEDHSAEALSSLIGQAGHDIVYCSTHEPGWRKAIADADLVAVAGGDGTVRKALTALGDTAPPLIAVLPLGWANNIARAFGIDNQPPEELIAGWATAERRRFRLGELHAPRTRKRFVETVGGGLFARAIEQAESVERPGQDTIELGLRLLRRLVEELPTQTWSVTLDGVEHHGDYLAVEAMVIGETGPQVPLAPAADPDDRHLDIVLIADDDREPLATYLEARLDDRSTDAPQFRIHRCHRAELRPLAPVPIRVDDALWDTTEQGDHAGPFRVSVARTTLEVLTPS